MHLQMPADSGFHTILPDQLYNYFTAGLPTAAQIKQLAGHGHAIESHTWDHPDMNLYIRYGACWYRVIDLLLLYINKTRQRPNHIIVMKI